MMFNRNLFLVVYSVMVKRQLKSSRKTREEIEGAECENALTKTVGRKKTILIGYSVVVEVVLLLDTSSLDVTIWVFSKVLGKILKWE